MEIMDNIVVRKFLYLGFDFGLRLCVIVWFRSVMVFFWYLEVVCDYLFVLLNCFLNL